MRRWSIEHVAAVVQLFCGIAFLAFALLRWAPFDSWQLGLFVAVVTAGFLVWAWWTWRKAAFATPAPRLRTPPPPPAPSPAAPSPSTPPRSTGTVPMPPAPEPLSPDGERELARVVVVLAAEGVFAPHPPDPADLAEAVADHGPPITADGVFTAVEEASYYHPEFRRDEHVANLALHNTQVEQFVDSLEEQVDDLLRLAGAAGIVVTVEQDDVGGVLRNRLRITAGGGEELVEWDGAVKALSTVLHVALATRLRRPGRRLAWVWSDAGVWVTALADGGVERLNAALGEARGEGWEWVDEQEPYATG